MKKYFWNRIWLSVIAVGTMFAVCGCTQKSQYDPNWHVYSPESRIALSNLEETDEGCYLAFPDDLVMMNAVLSDVILIGSIEDEGTVIETFPDPEEPKSTIARTVYTVRVQERWYGEIAEETFPLAVRVDPYNEATKPHQGDVLVLFLHPFYKERWHLTLGDERSMYVINPPDDTLFCLSDDETLIAFDGKKPADLKRIIKKKLKEFGKMDAQTIEEEGYIRPPGALGREQLSQEILEHFGWD